jgi:GGDEF domain-containing protein
VTASVGIGEFDPVTMLEVEDVIRAADQDLYRSKPARGRPPNSG